jgi:hypothetical protein
MTSNKFIVSDYYELLALHRALLESQFCDEPNDMDVSASPIIAKLHKQLLNSLIEADVERKGDEAKAAWDEWLKIDTERREWIVAIKRAKNESHWTEWDDYAKRTYVHNLLSPFDFDDKLVDLFINQATADR